MDSDDSIPASEGYGLRKRPHKGLFRKPDPFGSDSGSEEEIAPKVATSNRGGKKGSRLTKARKELKEGTMEAFEASFEKELDRRVLRRAASPASEQETYKDALEGDGCEPLNMDAEQLTARAGSQLSAILEVAKKSGNLKGGYVRQLKEAAQTIQEVLEVLSARTESEEARQLRRNNARLRQEVENLRGEVKAHRKEFEALKTEMATASKAVTEKAKTVEVNPPPFDVEEMKRSIIESVGTLVTARLANIEERLLPAKIVRPPLAADKRDYPATELAAPAAPAAKPTRRQTPQASQIQPQVLDNAAWPELPTMSRSQAGPSKDTWTAVVRKASKPPTRKSEPALAPKPAPKPVKKVNLAAPRAAAVVVTLQPEAAAKGVTYAQLFAKAEASINLGELGLTDGFRCRKSATGARVLELPGSQSADGAEKLAEKLRTALAGDAKIVRPVKCADLRIVGLDDSATKEKVAVAVARVGQCSVDQVKVIEIRQGPGGMGTTVAECPVTAAKLVADAGRILVGWSSARVFALEPRPMRCFRCMGTGHTRALCPSKVERGHLCFRCGQEGHHSSGCTKPINCAVCKDAGKPATHVMGGRSCLPPPIRGKEMLARTASQEVSATVQEVEMAE